MFLKSGDIVIMAKDSRLCYHAVPKILKTNVNWINESIKDSEYNSVNSMTTEKHGNFINLKLGSQSKLNGLSKTIIELLFSS